jgi:hypothetical protein
MIQKHGIWGGVGLLLVVGLASFSMAQDIVGPSAARQAGRGAAGFVATLERKVGLTPEQRDAVRGLLAQQRQQFQTLRQETDSKIRELLNPEQQKKFDQVISEQKARRTGRNPAS